MQQQQKKHSRLPPLGGLIAINRVWTNHLDTLKTSLGFRVYMHAQKHTHAKCGERKWTEGKQRNIPLDSQCSKLLTKTQMQNKNKCVQMRDFRGTQCHLSDSFTTNKREIECRLMKTDMAQGTNDYRSYCTLPWGKIKKSFMSHTVLKGGQIIDACASDCTKCFAHLSGVSTESQLKPQRASVVFVV